MAKVFAGEEFDSFKDRDSGAAFLDLEFRECLFSSCSISRTRDSERRSTVRNVRLLNCEVAACFLGPAIIENSLINGLKIAEILIAQSTIFRHVILKGPIDRLIIGQLLPGGMPYENYLKLVRKFSQANTEYYRTVDWALDISEGEFADFDIRGIPSRLIRRDPLTQVVVRREKAVSGEWKDLDLSGTWWSVGLKMLAESDWEDITLVAPKRHRQFGQALKGLSILREAGVAEPD